MMIVVVYTGTQRTAIWVGRNIPRFVFVPDKRSHFRCMHEFPFGNDLGRSEMHQIHIFYPKYRPESSCI